MVSTSSGIARLSHVEAEEFLRRMGEGGRSKSRRRRTEGEGRKRRKGEGEGGGEKVSMHVQTSFRSLLGYCFIGQSMPCGQATWVWIDTGRCDHGAIGATTKPQGLWLPQLYFYLM